MLITTEVLLLLVSCFLVCFLCFFAKVFSLVLRNRLNNWCKKTNNNKFNEFQFGFRDGCSTTDCIFMLYSLNSDKEKLFYALISGNF